jgi:hypothetical protein
MIQHGGKTPFQRCGSRPLTAGLQPRPARHRQRPPRRLGFDRSRRCDRPWSRSSRAAPTTRPIASDANNLDYCDRFCFAVGSDFPLGLLPPEEGLILADRFGGEIVREARLRTLSAARRKAMLVRFGRVAAGRLHGLLDPQP